MASSEVNAPAGHALGVGLERRTISRTPTEMGSLGLHRGSAFQGSKPLGVLPGRLGPENKSLPPCLRYGGTLHPPLGTVHASPLATGSKRRPRACGSAWTDAVVGKQPVVGLELRKELEKKPTCVVVKPYTEVPPKEVDIGLPQTQESDEAKNKTIEIKLKERSPRRVEQRAHSTKCSLQGIVTMRFYTTRHI